MANKLKAQNQEIRAEIARKIAEDLRRKNPGWSPQKINDAAFKAADLQIKQGYAKPPKPLAATPEPKEAEARDALARKWAKALARQNPSWSEQRVGTAAYRAADDQMRRDAGEVTEVDASHGSRR
jgi:hypothetical protein